MDFSIKLFLLLLLGLIQVSAKTTMSNITLYKANEDIKSIGLAEHNSYRSRHKTPPLKLDEKLNKIAQKCSDYLAANNRFEHMCEKYGENLYGSYGSSEPDGATMKRAAAAWYDEIKDYNWKNPEINGKNGHFTQLVWKSSENLGFGVSYDKKNKYTVILAIYDPPGNVMDKKTIRDNVLPPSTKISPKN